MSEEEISTETLTTLKAYRAENGWVIETRDGSVNVKVTAHLSPESALTQMVDWFGGAGVKPQQRRKMQGLKPAIKEVFSE